MNRRLRPSAQFVATVAAIVGAISGVATAKAGNDSNFEKETKSGIEFTSIPGAIGNGRRTEGWFTFQQGLKWKPGASERLRLELRLVGEFLVISPSQSSTGSQALGAAQAGTWNRSGSPHFVEDQELFLERRFGRARISIGSRTLRWGVADFFDPLDQINSRRMEKPTQATKRGEWMVYGESRGETLALEIFLIPSKRGAILPSQTSAWLPRQLYIPNLPDTEFTLPQNLEYRYRDREDADGALLWNAGARLLWRPGENEFSIQYDEGSSGFPSIRPSVSGPLVGITASGRRVIQADPTIQLTEIFYRERHYGTSFVRPIGETLARVQWGKTEPLYSGRSLARDRSDLSLSLERQFGMGSWGQLTVLAQGFKNLLEEESGGTDIASFSRFFDRASAIGLRFSPQETTSIMIGGLQSFGPKSGTIALASATFDLSPNLSAELSAMWFEASLDSPIGPFKDNDDITLKITAAF